VTPGADVIDIEVAGAHAVCRIDSPETRNAADTTLATTLIEALERLDGDAAVRCIVLTGTAEAFATGPDIRALGATGAEPPIDVPMPWFWERMRAIGTPIVAAVRGWALAFGFELALACDLLVVEERSTFGTPEITLGLIPSGGATQRLTRTLGKQRTMELILTGGRLSGRKAFEWGLANVLADKNRCVEQAELLASEIADRPPVALRLAKRAVDEAADLTLSEGLRRERELFAEALATDDRIEAVEALLGKRPPQFRGR